ncbi:hypothetical protein [Hahella ganghwensis]|uniref:hypothetical protein n=1 Tax=Hahella ganghwensis TaxID=286420 RepID=UPI00036F17B0|nr:hypothetical protein [Hahella ganghwensis]
MYIKNRDFFISAVFVLSCFFSWPATAETLDAWAQRALLIQNNIDNNLPLARTTWVGTHNSFANADDDNFSFGVNQGMSMRRQLDAGVRELVLDLHKANKQIRMCHNNTGFGGCVKNITGWRRFTAGLKDIRDWINAGNQDQVVMIKLELAGSAKDSLNKVYKAIDESGIISMVYRPDSQSYQGNGGDDNCTLLNTDHLTKSQILAAGKNVLMITYGCTGNSSFNGHVFNAAQSMKDFKSADDIENLGDGERYTTMSRVKDGTVKGGDDAKLKPSTVGGFLNAGLNIFELYGYAAEGSGWKVDGEYPVSQSDLVWSWDAVGYEPNGDGSCTVISHDSDRFRDISCGERLYAVCLRTNQSQIDWALTSQPVYLGEAQAQCQQDYGAEYQFSTPHSQHELNAVLETRHSNSLGQVDLWINYQRIGNQWIADHASNP